MAKTTAQKPITQLERLVVEYRRIDDIQPNEYNPNRQNAHEFELLCKSMKDDGFTQPIIVDRNGIIVDGEHRWRAASELGMAEVPIVEVPMDAAQARVATLRHNRARGQEDIALSVAVLRDLQKLGVMEDAADALALTDIELKRLLQDIPEPEPLPPLGEDADMTPNARAAEKMLLQARSAEEKAAYEADIKGLFRIYLTFAGEEALVVRTVLGTAPAVKLLELCKKEKGV